MSEVFFSLIVPMYNVSAYLRDCLDSLVTQRGTNYEILLVNDGSTDDGESICMEYAKKYPFFHYYCKENGGLSSARNFGIDKASGDYLLFIDSDDFLVGEDFLEKAANLLKKNPVELAMFLPLEYDENRVEIVKRHTVSDYPLGKIFDARSIIDVLYSSENPYITMAQTKIIGREYLIRHGLYFTDNTYHEDDEWIARVLLTYPKVILSELAGYGYRHRGESIITTTNKAKRLKRYNDKIRIADKILGLENVCKHRQCVTYFAAYYIGGVNDICKCDEWTRYIEEAGPGNVFKAMKYSLSKKQRLLYFYAKLFGTRAAKKVIVKDLRKHLKNFNRR